MILDVDIARKLASDEGNQAICSGYVFENKHVVNINRIGTTFRLVIRQDDKYYAAEYTLNNLRSSNNPPFPKAGDSVKFKQVKRKTTRVVTYE